MFHVILARMPKMLNFSSGTPQDKIVIKFLVLNGSLDLDAYLTGVAAGSRKGTTAVKKETRGQRRNSDGWTYRIRNSSEGSCYTIGYREDYSSVSRHLSEICWSEEDTLRTTAVCLDNMKFRGRWKCDPSKVGFRFGHEFIFIMVWFMSRRSRRRGWRRTRMGKHKTRLLGSFYCT